MTTKKVLLIVFGGLSTLIGVGLAVVGVVVLAVTGGDHFISSDSAPVSTPGYALVSEAAGGNARGIEATARVTVRSESGKAVFVGIAPPSVVQQYLGRADYTELTDLDFSPLRFRSTRHEGGAPADAPNQRPDWLQQTAGLGDQELTFDLLTPAYQVVVMNADGSAGVDVSVRLGLQMPLFRTIAYAVLVGAGVFLLVGILLLVWGIRAKGKDPVPEGQWQPREPEYATRGYGYPPGAGYPPQGWQPQQPQGPPPQGPPQAPPPDPPPPPDGSPPGAPPDEGAQR